MPRPVTRERYVRLDITHPIYGWNIVPGMEWRAGDDLPDLRALLAALVTAAPAPDVATLAQHLAQTFDRVFPGRGWFLEIEDAPGSWVQVYQPWGEPAFTFEAWDKDGNAVTAYPQIGVPCAP